MTDPEFDVEAEARALAETKDLLGHRHYAARDAFRRAISHGEQKGSREMREHLDVAVRLATECVRLSTEEPCVGCEARPDQVCGGGCLVAAWGRQL